jgi:acyl-CoA dehydrogenase
MLYEGANGIQAMDLVGRKLGKDGGRAVMAFFAEVSAFLKEQAEDASIAGLATPVEAALSHLQQATMWFMQNALTKPENAGAGATDYMHMFGLVVLGYMWVRIAKAAQAKLTTGANGDAARMEGRLATAKFFMQRLLPETSAQLARITSGADAVMALPAEAF